MATNYESFYPGSPSYLDPTSGASQGFSGTHFQVSGARLGFPGMFNTANQLGQAVEVIKSGVKAFEVTTLGMQGEDIVPIQHYSEMRALMKLSGVKPSLHGPLIDPAGFDQNRWGGEEGRLEHERRMYDAVQKAFLLNPKGEEPVPIVFHASNAIGGREYAMIDTPDGKKQKVLQKSIAVNRDTGQLAPIELDYRFSPTSPELLTKAYEDKETGEKHVEKGVPYKVLESIDSLNNTEWRNKITELSTFSKQAREVMAPAINYYENKLLEAKGKKLEFTQEEIQDKIFRVLDRGEVYVKDVELNFDTLFHKAYKYGNDTQRKELQALSNEYSKEVKKIKIEDPFMTLKKQELLDKSVSALRGITDNKERIREFIVQGIDPNKIDPRNFDPEIYRAPQLYQEIEDFATDKASKTFGNMAYKSYKDFTEKGYNAPMLAIENLPEHMAFNDAKQVRTVIEHSRKEFVELLMKKEKMDKEDAEKIANKQIGATWDVGHTNTLKKRGFSDKDIIEETQIMTGTHEGHDHGENIVKHIHLTDNFGFSDSHMALGQGNVPLQKILNELQKTGQIDKMNKIIESGAFISQFRKSPLLPSLTAMASPIYSMKSGPTFNQLGAAMGSYFGGYGTVNPEVHHSIYGAGFTGLPMDFGGQMGGGNSRFGGTPMA